MDIESSHPYITIFNGLILFYPCTLFEEMGTSIQMIEPLSLQNQALQNLVKIGALQKADLSRVEAGIIESGEPWPVVLGHLGLTNDAKVLAAAEKIYEVPIVKANEIPNQALKLGITTLYLKANRLLPLSIHGSFIDVAFVDPDNIPMQKGVTFVTGKTIRPRLISISDWRLAFNHLYEQENENGGSSSRSGEAGWTDDAGRLADIATEAPTIRLVDAIFTQAVDMGASDIHVESRPNKTQIRMRVDGQLQVIREEGPHAGAMITSRLKVLCDLDVADLRRPQDGRTSIAVRGRPVDIRVSTIPSVYGESVAIRLLERDDRLFDFSGLGFEGRDLEILTDLTQLKRGLVLITGPTGSGKTTTLYAFLNTLRAEKLKILTVEDPIEYFFADIQQTQVNEAAGMSFATSLRSFLRHDPDVIMVGEIRDEETARIAIQAALTGHLVLSTLHTNNAIGAIPRLIDMGVAPYLLASALSGVVAQRLIRRLCPSCREQTSTSKPIIRELQHLGLPNYPSHIWTSEGCSKCDGEGFVGRMVLSESFKNTLNLSESIHNSLPASELQAVIKEDGFISMNTDGANKIAKGKTALKEVLSTVEHQ